MAGSITRIIIPDINGPDPWGTALDQALKIAQSAGPSVREIVLLNHTKSQLSGTSLAAKLGANAARLNKGSAISLAPGINLRAETSQTLTGSNSNAVIIACYADDRMMLDIDGLGPVAGVVAVPDLPDGVDQWKDRWNTTVHGQAPKAATPLLSDAKVEGGLKHLTHSINLGNGVLGARDTESVDEVLRILRAKGHKDDPQKMESWAIQHGWKTGAAADLKKKAIRIFGLASKLSLAKFHNVDERYSAW